MTIADPGFASFAHAAFDPLERRALRTKLIVNAAKRQTAGFLRRHGGEIDRTSHGLTETLLDWSRSGATISETLLFPIAVRTIREANLDPAWVAALSAAHLHAAGRDGEWRASFARPAPLRFGTRLISPAREILVRARSGRVEVSLDSGAAIEVSAMSADVCEIDLGAVRAPILGPHTRPSFPCFDPIEFSRAPSPEIYGTLTQAFSILRSYAPDYFGWVADAVSAVVPLASPAVDGYRSFSAAGVNGVVFVSFPGPPLKMAELLVHECSHQYYHFGMLDTLFSNGMDDALYWSPYVQQNRSIDKILIAFHAFANIVLFYRDCLAAGMMDNRETAQEEIADNLQHLGPMGEHLQHSRGLSPAGRTLFELLRGRLFG